MENKPAKINLGELCTQLELASKIDSLNSLLNQTPPSAWLKEHKGVKYQPIERVRNNVLTIFQDYDWTITEVKVIANSILVTGFIEYTNPVTGRIAKKSGVGAWPIQLKAGSNPTDFDKIVQDAIQKNAPAAESLAFKNACKKIGRLFSDGADEDIIFNPVYSTAFENKRAENVENFDEKTLDTELKINQAIAGGLITKERGKELKAALKGELAI